MRSRRFALLFGLLMSFLISCSQPADTNNKGAQILALAKQATGGKAWDEIHVWHERGQTLSASGETSRYEHWGDLHSLRVFNSGSPGTHYMIYDGNAAYTCANPACDPRTLLDPVAIRAGAYLASFGFFFPERFAASFSYEGSRREHGILYDVVKVSPAGLQSMQLWIDQGTHRIFRMVLGNGAFRTDVSDYRQVGAVMVPFMVEEGGTVVKTNEVLFEPADAVTFSIPGTS